MCTVTTVLPLTYMPLEDVLLASRSPEQLFVGRVAEADRRGGGPMKLNTTGIRVSPTRREKRIVPKISLKGQASIHHWGPSCESMR